MSFRLLAVGSVVFKKRNLSAFGIAATNMHIYLPHLSGFDNVFCLREIRTKNPGDALDLMHTIYRFWVYKYLYILPEKLMITFFSDNIKMIL